MWCLPAVKHQASVWSRVQIEGLPRVGERTYPASSPCASTSTGGAAGTLPRIQMPCLRLNTSSASANLRARSRIPFFQGRSGHNLCATSKARAMLNSCIGLTFLRSLSFTGFRSQGGGTPKGLPTSLLFIGPRASNRPPSGLCKSAWRMVPPCVRPTMGQSRFCWSATANA